jgi:PadR family transcriptional regulator, regulatory protein PadR
MSNTPDVWRGTLARQHGLEDTGGDGLAARLRASPPDQADQRRSPLHQLRALYPALLKLEQEGFVDSEWGPSEKNRRAKYYRLTRADRKGLEKETREWEQPTSILARFLSPGEKLS